MAKLYSTKFTHISPVWYDLKSDGNKLVLEGQHNFDAKWVSELQSNGSLVLPRVVLEAFPGVVLMKKKLRDKAIDLIVNECRDKGYDGVVLESWSRWAVYGVLDDSELRNRVSHLPLSIINFLIILIKSFPRSCLAIDVSMCTCKVLLFTTSVPKCCYLVLRIWTCPCPDSQYRVMSHPLLGSNILGQS
jgi:hypothetical protein